LKKRVGKAKISIVRPSIVISALNEPIVGWTETLSAMGGLVFATMLGLINYLYCNERQILDIVPVDFCSNLILATTAYTAQCDPGTLTVAHSSTSNQNPAYLTPIIKILLNEIKVAPSYKQIF
jgi:hypothetical protein